MNNFLHHLNQALYDTNRSVWFLLRPSLIAITFGVLLFVTTFVPIVLVKQEWFMFPWAIFTIIAGSYGYITFLVYDRNRHPEPASEEIILESDNGLTIVKEVPATEPLTTTEVIREGIRWSHYVFLIIIGSMMMLFVVEVLRAFSTPDARSASLVTPCPENYQNTEGGRAAFSADVEAWVKQYLDTQWFGATEEQVLIARNESWARTCPETLEAYRKIPTEDTESFYGLFGDSIY